jgi:hypothetical protein
MNIDKDLEAPTRVDFARFNISMAALVAPKNVYKITFKIHTCQFEKKILE